MQLMSIDLTFDDFITIVSWAAFSIAGIIIISAFFKPNNKDNDY